MKKVVVGIAFVSNSLALFAWVPACSTTSNGSVVDGGLQIDADVDSGISYIQPGETPQNHFPTTPTCRTLRPPVMPDPPDAGDGGFSSCPDPNAPCCASDHDCVDGGAGKTNGRCVHIFYTECNWDGCVTSSDCASDQSCICASDDPSDMNRCAPSNCRSDADCGSGGYCSPTVSACFGGGVDGIYCHTPDDKCLNDSDCAALPVQKGEPQKCRFDEERKRWECSATTCAG